MLQAAQPLGDKQAQVAALHERTRDIMDKLRETLRDEHSFSFQVSRAVACVLPRGGRQTSAHSLRVLHFVSAHHCGTIITHVEGAMLPMRAIGVPLVTTKCA